MINWIRYISVQIVNIMLVLLYVVFSFIAFIFSFGRELMELVLKYWQVNVQEAHFRIDRKEE